MRSDLLPVHPGNYKPCPRVAGRRGGTSSLSQKKALQMGGRQDAGHAAGVATLGDALSGKWHPWEGAVTEGGCVALAREVL